MGIRLAQFVVERLRRRREDVELIDAKAINLPMLDRMYKEYPRGEAPEPLERLARKIRDADGFVFVTGEYNWGVQPGLKNLTDHFLEEWFWRHAAIASYSGDVCLVCARQPPGPAYLPRWGWWSSRARSPLVRSDRPYRRRANPLARVVRHLSGHSHALPTISGGGWKRRKHSDNAKCNRISPRSRLIRPLLAQCRHP